MTLYHKGFPILQGVFLYKGFPFLMDFPLRGIFMYNGFPFIRDLPFYLRYGKERGRAAAAGAPEASREERHARAPEV